MFADIIVQPFSQSEHYHYRKLFVKHLYDNKEEYRVTKIVYGMNQFFMCAQDAFYEETSYKISRHFFNLIIKYEIDFDPITEEIYYSNPRRLPSINERTQTNSTIMFKNIIPDDLCFNPNLYI